MMPNLPQFSTLLINDFWGVWVVLFLALVITFWGVFRFYFFSQYHQKVWHKTLQQTPAFAKIASPLGRHQNSTENNFRVSFLKAYDLGNWPVGPGFYVFAVIFLSLIVGFLLGILSTLFWGVMGGVCLFLVGIGVVFLKAVDQKNKAIEQLPSFLEALSQSLQAGYSVTSALSFMADELDPPLQQSIKKVNHLLSLQVPLETAFQTLAEEFQQPEIDFLVEGTLVQIKIGGNLVVLFENMGLIIEEKLKLKRDIKSFTSQGKLSGIFIATLWPVSLLMFSWLSPQHTEILFSTPQGQILLFVSLFLELVGFFFIWRIIRVQL